MLFQCHAIGLQTACMVSVLAPWLRLLDSHACALWPYATSCVLVGIMMLLMSHKLYRGEGRCRPHHECLGGKLLLQQASQRSLG